MNIYMITIDGLVEAVFVLLTEEWRIHFIHEIGN